MNILLSAHLRNHGGLVSTRQALGLGMSERQIEGMVARQELIREHRGVYRHAAVAETFELRMRAALLAAGDRAVISHRCGIGVHGARNFSCDLVELTVRSSTLPKRHGILIHRSSTLGPADVERRDGLWVTTRARTLIDAAAVLDPTLVTRIATEWFANHLLHPDEVFASIARAGNHAGAHRLRSRLEGALDAGLDPSADSVPEMRLGELLTGAGLRPILHHLVTLPTGHTFELDWSYPDARLAVELDGYGIHMRSEDAFDDDRFRRNELEIAGWRVLNVSARQLRRRPERTVDQVRRALLSGDRVELTTLTEANSTR